MLDGENLEMLKSLLEDTGIPCMIRNENLSSAMGELPFQECFPELWIMKDQDYPRAAEMVQTWRSTRIEIHDSWICRCGETIEGQFTSCWNCGNERPAS
jgi:putative signal transducing protein